MSTAAPISFVAVDRASVRLLEAVQAIAPHASAVLVRGESGSGKDMVAQLLHCLGQHPDEPLLRLDCLTLPRDVIETELFGHERNSFPGAPDIKRGLLELAGAGSLALDEIAALPLSVQARLLRAIEEKRFERVGGINSIPARARIVALTSLDLENAVARRTFREDLYYRLNACPVLVPPLRQRPGDIRPLAVAFLARMAEMHRKPYLRFSSAALEMLENYSYPGNVRELRQVVQSAIAYAKGTEIMGDDLPAHVRDASVRIRPVNRSLEQVEREHIAHVLDYTRGKKSAAAGILGISRKTLLQKRKRYGLA